MKNLVQIAANEIGVKEIEGADHNPGILTYAKEAGFSGITDDETPWCSIFVNWCCEKAGLQRTHKANARSWLYVGKPVNDPAPGDIVIFWRNHPQSWEGHVGIFLGYNKSMSMVYTLGGNQRNSVSIQAFEASKVLGFRRLYNTDANIIPDPTLKSGDISDEVANLQTVLNELGFDCGAIDGVFGPKTLGQLKALQRQKKVPENGIYDDKMKTILESILQS
jgi:uncharacterized protein (TIGR02594 family)